MQATGLLASALSPFEVRLSGVGREESYFRSLYVPAEPSGPLTEARARAEEVFGGAASEEFVPHMSLLYGDIDNSAKDDIIKTIGSAVTANFTVEGLSLYRVGMDVHGWERVGDVFPVTGS